VWPLAKLLTGTNCEIFVTELFTLSDPIRVGN
jgi:hypothetical protein